MRAPLLLSCAASATLFPLGAPLYVSAHFLLLLLSHCHVLQVCFRSYYRCVEPSPQLLLPHLLDCAATITLSQHQQRRLKHAGILSHPSNPYSILFYLLSACTIFLLQAYSWVFLDGRGEELGGIRKSPLLENSPDSADLPD